MIDLSGLYILFSVSIAALLIYSFNTFSKREKELQLIQQYLRDREPVTPIVIDITPLDKLP